MCEFVEVGGVMVTQERLTRAIAIVAETNGLFDIPDGYLPSISLFGPSADGIRPTPEQELYALMQRNDLVGLMARAMVGSEPCDPQPVPQRQPTPTDVVLDEAGFPAIVALDMEYRSSEPPQLSEWADAYGRDYAPWLWISGGDRTDRTVALARAVMLVDRAMFDGRVPRGQIVYRTARRLSDEYNRALNYGERGRITKDEAMEPYERCPLLLLDGMGGERANGRGLEAIERVLRARHENALPTALAAPAGPSLWASAYGTADRDRAHDVAMLVNDGLSGFARGLPKDEKKGLIMRRFIRLDSTTTD